MKGDEAARLIREKHGSDLPIVALTASALTVERDSLMASGFSEVLMKPINPGEIFATMANFLDLRYATREGGTKVIENGQAAFGRLADLPDSMKQKLREGIDLGDLSGIETCVEEIRAVDPALADSLEQPLANFAFGRILEGLEKPS
jgi:DNA-binding response OmpR family regulator